MRKEDKASKRAASSIQARTLDSVITLETQLSSGFTQLTTKLDSLGDRMVDAIKTIPTPSTPATNPWIPVIQGIVSGIASGIGLNVSSVNGVTSSSSVDPALDGRLSKLESQFSTITNSVNTLTKGQASLTSSLNTLTQTVNDQALNSQDQFDKLTSAMAVMVNTVQTLAQTKSTSSNDSNNSNNGTPPASDSTPSSQNSPPILPEIVSLKKVTKNPSFKDCIVTADLEAIITPEGNNEVYMAAWYNGTKYNIMDISQWSYNKELMLQAFWQDLINNNFGKICYFHNWGGYDSILSLSSLLNLGLAGYKFSPILKDGEIMCISVLNSKGKAALVIKDSIRIIPGALGKLAKDWKVETQKDHFPHYFYLNNLLETLAYTGSIPEYGCFEPKRTTLADYNEMVHEFKNQTWSFLEVSKDYILGDVKALFQIMIKFFETLIVKFPINPLSVLSAPSTAYKIWRTVQLPKLNQEGLKVYDLARTLDSNLRKSYCGGIVDVYKPHLIGEGYYYDVNSLYPTAMCKSMPVGIPKLLTLTVKEFLEGDFFGFVEATVQAPSPDTPGGYIGLLPLKQRGKLICPGGIFSDLYFSEELKFALANGYKLVAIKQAYSFQRGEHNISNLLILEH
jgi:uncharacterized protein YoxC